MANLAGDLGQVRDETVKYTMLSHFYKADAKYGEAITRAVKADTGRVEKLAAGLSQ